MPDWLEPMAATLTQDRFIGHDWLFERKFDGIRLLAYKCGSDVQLYSRNRLPQHLPALAGAIANLPVHEVILDGEVTWDGGSAYHVFDILWLNGRAVTALPLEDRRALLQELPFEPPMQRVELVEDQTPWERARREGWEGVIAKRRGSPYEHRRSKHWLKMKCETSHEFVVGGFTDPQGRRGSCCRSSATMKRTPSSLPEIRHRLRHTKLLLDLRTRLDAIELPDRRYDRQGLPRLRAHWCVLEIVVQIASSNGPYTASCGTAVDRSPSPTRTRATSHGSSGDHPPEKVLFPDDGITKGDLAAYYEAMAPRIVLTCAADRSRCGALPAFWGRKGFWQKMCRRAFQLAAPSEVPKKDGVVHHPVITDTRSLLWMTNQNTVTQHVWTSRIPHLNHPISRIRSRSVQRRRRSGASRCDWSMRDLLEELHCARIEDHPAWRGFHIVVPLTGKTPHGSRCALSDAVGCSS
jgi:bifunctional non-homologous end joining protein LigD